VKRVRSQEPTVKTVGSFRSAFQSREVEASSYHSTQERPHTIL